MKNSVELSFLKFIKQKIKIIFIIILIPQLFSFTYFIFVKSNNCYAEYKILTRFLSSDENRYFEHVLNQLKSEGKIKFTRISMPYLEFEGKNFECPQLANEARKSIDELDLKIKNVIKEETEELNKLFSGSSGNNNAQAIFLTGQTSFLYKNLGIDMSLLTLSEKLGIKYSIISLSDGIKIDKDRKLFFFSIIGSLILSLLIIFAIFFYKYLFRRF